MKIKSFFVAASAALLLATACNKVPNSGEVEFKTEVDSVSYALGYFMANQIKQSLKGPFDTIDYKSIAKAYANSNVGEDMLSRYKESFDTVDAVVFKTAFMNELGYGKSYFDETSADAYLRKVYGEKQKAKQAEMAVKGEENVAKGKAFLESNKARAEVTTTASGLQYEVLKEGKGAVAKASDRVKCHYHGMLIDGTVFDSSVDRGEPATFGVNRVIKGWTEALQLMPVGSKWKLFIPSELAYGAQGSGAKIGANETLIFEVEVLEIVN